MVDKVISFAVKATLVAFVLTVIICMLSLIISMFHGLSFEEQKNVITAFFSLIVLSGILFVVALFGREIK